MTLRASCDRHGSFDRDVHVYVRVLRICPLLNQGIDTRIYPQPQPLQTCENNPRYIIDDVCAFGMCVSTCVGTSMHPKATPSRRRTYIHIHIHIHTHSNTRKLMMCSYQQRGERCYPQAASPWPSLWTADPAKPTALASCI